MILKKYFLTRKQIGIETEKLITRRTEDLQKYWSKIMEQRILQAKDKIYIEKTSEINELEKELQDKKEIIKNLRKSNMKNDLEVEKYKNELKTKIRHLDYQTAALSEICSRVVTQIGQNENIIKTSEKLLKKDI